jgi:hypothetical protein
VRRASAYARGIGRTRRIAALVLAAVLGAVALGPAASADALATAKSKFALTSTAFTEGGSIPVAYSCVGAGTSPPLSWTGVPKRTKQLALIVDDPDAPSGTFTHWVLAGVPKSTTSIAQGRSSATRAPGVRSTSRCAHRPGRHTTTSSRSTR